MSMRVKAANKMIDMGKIVGRGLFCRAKIYSMIDEGLWPVPIKPLGGKSARWLEYEVDELISAIAAGAPEDALRKLVVQLVADRSVGGCHD